MHSGLLHFPQFLHKIDVGLALRRVVLQVSPEGESLEGKRGEESCASFPRWRPSGSSYDCHGFQGQGKVEGGVETGGGREERTGRHELQSP